MLKDDIFLYKDTVFRFCLSSIAISRLCINVILLITVCSYVFANPEGGRVVGGVGSINQSGLDTIVTQNTDRMAIDWNSYNLNIDERIHYLQPNSSSISLNRILSSNGSKIHGQIEANGHVILVNPNGIFFGETSRVNVGGIIASGLTIDPTNFMNEEFVFSEIEGSDGSVINSGVISAALGGSVSLIGRHVHNAGFISAKLGAVNLAAGKEAVVTFDQGGLIGVRISREILQEELGVDPAVINSGEIMSDGGQILLTSSVSHDLFSQVVNVGDMERTASVVIHDDGSFTLGAGADVLNTGSLNVSTGTSRQDAGRIIVLGENITNSGVIQANALSHIGGEIELHATDATLLVNNSLVEAKSDNENVGGVVKILGNRVGLFDQSIVNVSGASGGGAVLMGGDFQGSNQYVRNAERTVVGSNTSIYADAIERGHGGTVILWSDKNTYFAGNISVTGGERFGNGGFIEVSGKKYLRFRGTTDRSAIKGQAGSLLLDPRNITIVTTGNQDSELTGDQEILFADCTGFSCDSSNDDWSISSATLVSELNNGSVKLQAYEDILVSEAITVTNIHSNSLTLEAGDDILINGHITLTGGNINITSGYEDMCPLCNDLDGSIVGLDLVAREGIALAADLKTTSMGDITLTVASNLPDDAIIITGSQATRSLTTDSGIITFNDKVLDENYTDLNTGTEYSGSNRLIVSAGTGQIIFNDSIGGNTSHLSELIINSASSLTLNEVSVGSGLSLDDIGINITADTINLNGNLQTKGIIDIDTNTYINAGNIVLNGNVTLNNNITIDTDAISSNGALSITGDINSDVGNTRGLTIITDSADVNIQGAIGATNRLGDFVITSANDVNLGISSVSGGLTANRVEVTQSTSFDTAGFDITTTQNNNVAAGHVDINATQNIDINTINAQGALVVGDGNGLNGGAVTLNGGDINVTAINVYGSNANGTGSAAGTGGNVNVTATTAGTATGSIDVASINSYSGDSSADQDGAAGGVVNINGTEIAVGNINSSGGDATSNNRNGGDAGQVTLTATDNNGTPSITLSGTIDSSGGNPDGTGAAGSSTTTNLILAGSGAVEGAIFLDFEDPNDYLFGLNIAGSNGADTLTAPTLTSPSAASNTWAVTADDQGTLNTSIVFSAIENLIGGSGDDTFVISDGATVSGFIDGAGGNDDVLNIIAYTTAVTIDLGTTGISDFSINNIEQINASASNANTLVGDNIANTWDITGIDSGDVGNLSFSGFRNLTGSDNSDNFNLNAGSITGVINGAGGTDTLQADNRSNTWVVTSVGGGLVTGVNGFENIENLAGNTNTDNFTLNGGTVSGVIDGAAGTDTLTADNVANIWLVTSNGGGTVTGTGGFANMENLSGNLNNDSFTLNSGNVIGNVNGGDGIDTLTASNTINIWNITANNGGTVNGVGSFSNIENLTGNILTDNFSVQGSFTIDGVIDGGGNNDTLILNAYTADLIVTLDPTEPANFRISSVEQITADTNNTNTFIGANAANIWEITAADTGSVNSINFSGFHNLTGNINTDNFILNNGTVTGILNGSSGIDTLTADNVANTWTVTSNGSGVVTGSGGFANIENLTGNVSSDTFIFNGGSIGGTVDGGRGGSDTIRGRPVTSDWLLTNDNAGSITDVSSGNDVVYVNQFQEIETLEGRSVADTLQGENQNNHWRVNGNGAGYVAEDALTPDDTISFSGMLNLIGGTENDIFTMDASGIITGSVNGSLGVNTLAGRDIQNTWNITGANQGNVADISLTETYVVSFQNIQNLVGGSNDDRFAFSGVTASIESVVGGSENLGDTADFSQMVGSVDVTLGAVISDVESFIGNYNSNISSNSSTLIALDGNNTWTINGFNDGRVNGITFFNFNNLTGGTGVDTFEISGSTGALSGTINGGTNTDTIGQRNVATNWTITGDGAGNFIYNNGTGTSATVTTHFDSVETLIGSNAVDRFTFQTQSVIAVDGSGVNGVTDILDLTQFASNVVVTVGASNIGLINVASIEQIDANNSRVNTLQGQDVANEWVINGTNSGQVTSGGATTFFTGFHNLTGANTSDDSFGVTASGSISGIINGNGGSNTLTGRNVNSTWAITNANRGNITEEGVGLYINDFQNIQTLIGLNGNDNFVFGLSGSLVGTINGGLGNDSLTGANESNNWIIHTSDSGTLNTLSFQGIENLFGGDDEDVFVFETDTVYSGIIDARLGLDSVDLSSRGLINVDLTTNTINDVSNTERVIGNNSTSSLTGLNTGDNTWTITNIDLSNSDVRFDGQNDGLVQNGARVIEFVDFNSLIGGTVDDIFVIESTGSFTGVINGSTGNNSIEKHGGINDWILTGVHTGTINNGNFSNIQTLIGGSGTDALSGLSQNNNWQVTDSGTGTVAENISSPTDLVTFSNMDTLIGNTSDDLFVIGSLGTLAGSIDGGMGTNTLQKTDGNNSWVLNSQFQGTLTGINGFSNIQVLIGGSGTDSLTGRNQSNNWQLLGSGFGTLAENVGSPSDTVAFSNMNNLVGGSASDLFLLPSLGSVSGLIDGNAGSNTLQHIDGTNSWVLTGQYQGNVNRTGGFSNIQILVGGTGVDTLTGLDQSNNWQINGTGAGTVQQNINTPTDTLIFSNMQNLIGGILNDIFVMNNSASLTGIIDGNMGANALERVNGSNNWVLNGQYQGTVTGVAGFSNIQTLTGGSGIDVLTGRNQNNDWQITGFGSGSVKQNISLPTDTMNFTNMNALTGGVANDLFVLGSAGGLNGTIDGGAGENTLERIDGTNSWVLTERHQGTLTGIGGFNLIQILTGGGGTDTLTGRNQNNNWLITGLNTGTVKQSITTPADGITFSDIENITGGASQDNITLTLSSANISGVIDGGAGTGDTLSVVSATNDSVIWNIVALDQGEVVGRVNSFRAIENLNGSEGADTFNFINTIASITGLIDGGELAGGIYNADTNANPANDPANDILNLEVFTDGVVVELGPTATAGNPVTDIVANVNAYNIEQINAAADNNPGALNEANNWLVINHNDDVQWELTQLNAGYVQSVFNATENPFNAIPNRRTDFNNVGSLQGGSGNEASNIRDGIISGTYIEGTGLRNLDFSGVDPAELIVIEIDDRISRIKGNNNTLLKVSDDAPPLNIENDWLITDANAGSFTANPGTADMFSFNFSAVNQLQGGTGIDSFVFGANGNLVDGSINGGAGVNTVVATMVSSDLSFGLNEIQLDVPVTGSSYPQEISRVDLLNSRTDIIDLLGISHLQANSSSTINTRLYSGSTEAYTWSIGESGINTLRGNGNQLSFSGIDEVIGGAGDDTFQIFTLGNVIDKYDGGSGVNVVSVENITGPVSVYLDPTDARGNVYVTNVDQVVGNNTNSTLVATNIQNNWQITSGVNDGVLNSTLSFENFNHLVGGDAVDNFTINAGDITGTITAGGGADSLNITIAEGGNRRLTFIGGNDNDQVTLSGDLSNASTPFREIYNPDVLGTEQLLYTNDINTDSINYREVETLQDNVAVNEFTINAPAAATNFVLGAGSVNVNTQTPVNYNNKENLIVAGRSSDTILIDGAINLAGQLTLQNASVSTLNPTTSMINARGLLLDGVRRAGDASNRIRTNIVDLSLLAVNGDVYMQEQNTLNLAQIQTNGFLDVILTGNVTDSATLSSLGGIRIATPNGNIILDEANQISGEIAANASGIVTLNNTTTTNLSDVTAQILNVNSSGAILDFGDININGSTALSSGGSITLDRPDNHFNVLTVNQGTNVTLLDTNALTLAGINATGIVNVSSNGLSVNGEIVGSSIILDAGDQAANIGNRVTASNLVDITGNAIAVNGLVSGDVIDIDGGERPVQLNAGLDTGAGGNISVNGNQILQNATVNSGSAITFVSATHINQGADITSIGNISLAANNGDINMANGTLTSGNDVSYSNTNGNMSIANINGGSVALNSSGTVTQHGTVASSIDDITISGFDYIMNVGAVTQANAGSITIAANDSIFAQQISAQNSITLAAQSQSIQLNNIVNSTQGSIVARANQSLSVNQDLTAQNAITLTAQNSNITQNANLNAAQGDISLSSGAQITMADNSSTNATQGSILYAANNDISATVLTAINATVGLTSNSGQIIDANADNKNLIANRVELTAITGIGAVDGLEMTASVLSASNQTGAMILSNTGDIDIERLHNVGDITFNNDTDIKIASSGIDAGFGVGALTLQSFNGSVLGLGVVDFNAADITARVASIVSPLGDFGSPVRPMVVNVRDNLFIGAITAWSPFFLAPTSPSNIQVNAVDVDLFDLSTLGGEQLVEVETLGEIDPAIFTDVRNYLYDEVSIRLPRDQLYEDDLEEYEEYEE